MRSIAQATTLALTLLSLTATVHAHAQRTAPSGVNAVVHMPTDAPNVFISFDTHGTAARQPRCGPRCHLLVGAGVGAAGTLYLLQQSDSSTSLPGLKVAVGGLLVTLGASVGLLAGMGIYTWRYGKPPAADNASRVSSSDVARPSPRPCPMRCHIAGGIGVASASLLMLLSPEESSSRVLVMSIPFLAVGTAARSARQ